MKTYSLAEFPLAPKLSRAAKACDVSRNTLKKLIDQGEISAVKIGSRLHIPRHEIMRLCGMRKGKHGSL